MYRFKIRNIEMVLSEPTQEAFEKAWDEMFLSIFLEEIKPQIKEELQLLIDTQTWEELEVNENETNNRL